MLLNLLTFRAALFTESLFQALKVLRVCLPFFGSVGIIKAVFKLHLDLLLKVARVCSTLVICVNVLIERIIHQIPIAIARYKVALQCIRIITGLAKSVAESQVVTKRIAFTNWLIDRARTKALQSVGVQLLRSDKASVRLRSNICGKKESYEGQGNFLNHSVHRVIGVLRVTETVAYNRSHNQPILLGHV